MAEFGQTLRQGLLISLSELKVLRRGRMNSICSQVVVKIIDSTQFRERKTCNRVERLWSKPINNT